MSNESSDDDDDDDGDDDTISKAKLTNLNFLDCGSLGSVHPHLYSFQLCDKKITAEPQMKIFVPSFIPSNNSNNKNDNGIYFIYH